MIAHEQYLIERARAKDTALQFQLDDDQITLVKKAERNGWYMREHGRCGDRQNYFYLHGPDYGWVFGVSIRDTSKGSTFSKS